MTQELPSIYYVYHHEHPDTGEVVYVGKGSRGRAWHCAESNSRGASHAVWMNGLIADGFTPDAWVVLLETGLTEADAYAKEALLIDNHLPIFNSKHDAACKLTQDNLSQIKLLRENGNTYKGIGEIVGFSTMTIYRALNGKTKNYVL